MGLPSAEVFEDQPVDISQAESALRLCIILSSNPALYGNNPDVFHRLFRKVSL